MGCFHDRMNNYGDVRSPERLAGAGYLELCVWRHCVTRLRVCPVGVQTVAELQCDRRGR